MVLIVERKIVDRKQVLSSDSPYVELFGVDGMGRGRPQMGSPAYAASPRLRYPPESLVPDNKEASKIRQQARTRATTVLKTLYGKEFTRIFDKELEHLSEQHAIAADEESSSSSASAGSRRGRQPGRLRPVRKVEEA